MAKLKRENEKDNESLRSEIKKRWKEKMYLRIRNNHLKRKRGCEKDCY